MTAINRVEPKYSSAMQWVSVDRMSIRQECQRRVDPAWVDRIANAFDPDLIGKPLLWHPTDSNGEFVVLDGNHRRLAVIKALGKNQRIECEVISGISLKDAARLFLGRNRVRISRPIDRFMVSLTAQDPAALAIARTVHKAGLKIGPAQAAATVTAVVALQRIVKLGSDEDQGLKLLAQVLELHTHCWGRDRDSFLGDVMIGTAMVFARSGKQLDLDNLRSKLASFSGGCRGLHAKADALKAALGVSQPGAVAAVITNTYNKGKTGKSRLPDWSARDLSTPSKRNRKASTSSTP